MHRNEAQTRHDLLDPELARRGWLNEMVKVEETAPVIDTVDGKPFLRKNGRTDYTLRIRLNDTSAPIAVAVIEAKAEKFDVWRGFDPLVQCLPHYHLNSNSANAGLQPALLHIRSNARNLFIQNQSCI